MHDMHDWCSKRMAAYARLRGRVEAIAEHAARYRTRGELTDELRHVLATLRQDLDDIDAPGDLTAVADAVAEPDPAVPA